MYTDGCLTLCYEKSGAGFIGDVFCFLSRFLYFFAEILITELFYVFGWVKDFTLSDSRTSECF